MRFTGYRLALLVCALLGGWLLPGSSSAATEWQSLLSEDFGGGEVSFYTGQASEAFYGIDDQNRYVIDGLNTEIDSLSALTKNLYYYYVESECELIDTRIGEMAFCGLVFHYNKKIPGKLAYYVFYIYADGYYGAKRVIGDNAEVILPLTKSDLIDIDRPNVLAVDARGTRFELYINGRYVDGFTDVRIDGGGFGFYVSQQARAAFDNFEVKVERRGGGPAEVESPELLEGSSDNPGRSSVSRDENFNGYNFPDIPKDPDRPVYPWEVGVDKSETARKERAARDRELEDLAQRRLENDMSEPRLEEQPQLEDNRPLPADDDPRAGVEDTKVLDEAPVALNPPPVRDEQPQDNAPAEQADPGRGREQAQDEQPAAADDSGNEDLSTHSFGDAADALKPVTEDVPPPAAAEEKPAETVQPAADEQAAESQPPANDEQAEQAAEDETYTNVSLPGESTPAQRNDSHGSNAAEEQPAQEQPQATEAEAEDEGPSEAEIMAAVRNSSDDWSDSAPPYRPPAEEQPRETSDSGNDDESSQPAEESTANGSEDDGELKGIELPPLEFARPSARDNDGEQAREQPAHEEPVDDQAQAETDGQGAAELPLLPEDGPAEEEAVAPAGDDEADDTADADDSAAELSLFPAGNDAGSSSSRTPDPSDVLGSPDGNPGELKLPPSQNANDASRDYDPFEDNPDVESVYDDFTEQRWPVADGATSSYRYFGAAYEIDNTKSDTMAISYQQGNFTDARYGLDVEYLAGLDYVGYGIATRFSVNNGNVSYYGMFVSQSGEFLLLKVLDGKEYVLRDWSAAPSLSRTLSNRIGMELIGNSIHCIVNGEVVATVTDDSLDSGGYALLCGPGTSTRFDNLTIKGLTAGDD